MKLSEILNQKDQLRLAFNYLKKQGFSVELGSIWVRVRGGVFSVNLYWDEDLGEWMAVWYKDGRKVKQEEGLSFEDAVKTVEPLKPSKVKEALDTADRVKA